MSVTKEEIRKHLNTPTKVKEESGAVSTDVLALWCQKWYDKMKEMTSEEREELVKEKEADYDEKSSWSYIKEIIEEEENEN